LLIAAVTIAGSAVGARAATARETSANWAGYVASEPGVRFHKVSGSWVQPAASCSAGAPANTAFWVGIGGYHSSSRALAQIGTEVDCTSTGSPRYSAWYEMIPSGSVDMPLTVHPGDRVTASVAVTGHRVRMRLHNVTTNATFTKTLKAPTVDLRSADWVLEAPSLCDDSGVCQVSQLANFGTFGFSDASATTTSGHTGLIADPAWSATAIDLVPGSGPDGGAGPNIGVADGASASTGDLSASGGAFDVAYRTPATTAPAPTDGATLTLPVGP
jgi:hypothetical protein